MVMHCVVLVVNPQHLQLLIQFLHSVRVVSLLVHLLVPLPVVLMKSSIGLIQQFECKLLVLGVLELTYSKLADPLTLLLHFKLLLLLV
jgi:hypothetical protein